MTRAWPTGTTRIEPTIETINEALRQNPNYIRYLYVDKLSDKISVIVSDQSTIMDLKGIMENKAK